MKFSTSTLVFLIFIGFFARLTKSAEAPKEAKPKSIAHVRILHAIAGAPAADFYFDDKKVAEKITFKTLGDYQEIESGKTIIKMTASENSALILDDTTTFTRDGYYTIAPFGTMDKAKLTVQNDNTGKSDENKARIRVFHLAPSAPRLSFAFVSPTVSPNTKPAIIKDLPYGEDTTKLIEPGTQILQAGIGEKMVYEMPNVTLEAGKRYAIFAVGKPNVSGAQAFELLIQAMGDESKT